MRVNRSTLYYERRGESQFNLALMEEIDRLFIAHPTLGVEKMTALLKLNGYSVNVKRVRRLMRKMNLMAIYPQKSLSGGGNAKYVYSYLLRGLDICRSNQVWSTDISYIPMNGGFMYMYAIIDVYSRYILGWRLSNTLSASNAYELLEECVERYGAPEIMNTDQGVQYTSKGWIELLQKHYIQISMDGRGRCKDNIWIERFWRTLKQDHIYIHPADTVTELRTGITGYMDFYNNTRPHETLGNRRPIDFYEYAA